MLNIEIKILSVNELNDFRTIRLSALEKSPRMFGSTYVAEVAKPPIFLKSAYQVQLYLAPIIKIKS